MKTLTEEQIEYQRERFNAMQRDGWDMDYPIALCDMALEYLKCREDAERYRALRQQNLMLMPRIVPWDDHGGLTAYNRPEDIDAAIDAARKEGA
jgi:hypothetical protein